MQTAMLTSASFAYTIKCFHTQFWDLGGLGSRRSFTTPWRTASLSRVLGRGGTVGTTTSVDQSRLHNDRGHLTGQVQRRQHLRHRHRHRHRRWRWVDAREFGLLSRGNACPARNKPSYKQGNLKTQNSWIVGTAATNLNT